LETHIRAGTPPTRRGAYNGVVPGLSPAVPASLNPTLVVKAVRAPVKNDSPGKKPQFGRKRGPDGKLLDAENAGTASTAQDDAERAERAAKLQSGRMNDKLVDAKTRASAVSRGAKVKNPSVKDNHEEVGRVDNAFSGEQIPGMSSAAPMDTVNDPVS